MHVHGEGDLFLSKSLVERGLWEPCQTEALSRLIRPGMTILDVGANIGYYTIIAAKLAGADGRVFAFEAENGNFELLRLNLELNGCRNTEAELLAVSDRSGTGCIHGHPLHAGERSLFPYSALFPLNDRFGEALLRQPTTLFTNFLCFASEQSYLAAKERLAG